jgi:hypothetical protein
MECGFKVTRKMEVKSVAASLGIRTVRRRILA